MKKLQSIVILIILATVWNECVMLCAQERYYGRVITEKGDSIPYANVMLLNAADSTYLTGMMSDRTGNFDFTHPTKGLLKVSHIGYLDTYVKNCSTEDIVVVMHEDAAILGEVVIKANVPITRIDGDALVTNIKGTILEKMGTANEVLGRLPGVIDNDGTIEVVGKGAPVIYINGRLVQNIHELQQIGAEKIAKIEVVTNPGARYDATVNSVIRITIEKETGEGFAFNNKTDITYRDFIYGLEQVNLNYRKNNWDLFGRLEYDKSKRRWQTLNVQKAWLTPYHKQNIQMESLSQYQFIDGQIGFTYTPSPHHSLGMYYKADQSASWSTPKFTTDSWIDEILEEHCIAMNNVDARETEHLVDGYYSGKIDNWTLDGTFDFMWKSNSEKQASEELSDITDARLFTITNGEKARLLAGKFNVSHPLWKGTLNLGIEYTDSRREDRFYNEGGVMANNNTRIKENNAALYLETMQRLGILVFQLGVRYEHINNNYYMNSEESNEQSYTYNKIFPTVMCVLPLGESMAQLSYAKKYYRPHYSQLSSTVIYVNRYLYEKGNPFLRASFNDIISLNYVYKWLMFSGNYTHVTDQIISSSYQYLENSNITILSKENSYYNLDKIQLMASLAPHLGKFHPTLLGGIMSQFYTIDHCGEKKKMNLPMWIVRFNNILELPHAHTLNVDLNWNSRGNTENVELSSSWQIDLGINKEIGKHWDIRVTATDIFNTARTRSFTSYCDIREIYMETQANTRAISCTVKYKFNAAPSQYKGKGAGETERLRL